MKQSPTVKIYSGGPLAPAVVCKRPHERSLMFSHASLEVYKTWQRGKSKYVNIIHCKPFAFNLLSIITKLSKKIRIRSKEKYG